MNRIYRLAVILKDYQEKGCTNLIKIIKYFEVKCSTINYELYPL